MKHRVLTYMTTTFLHRKDTSKHIFNCPVGPVNLAWSPLGLGQSQDNHERTEQGTVASFELTPHGTQFQTIGSRKGKPQSVKGALERLA